MEMQTKTSDEARRDFRRLLTDTQRGVHTEITRYNEGVAAVVPVEWMDDIISILRDLRQVEAGWDIHVPVERLREIAKAAAALLPPTLVGEMAEDYEDEAQQYVDALKTGRHSLRDHRDDCHCGACRSLPGRRGESARPRIVPVLHDDHDQGS